MGKLLVRNEAELHTKVFKKAFGPNIRKINALDGTPDAILRLQSLCEDFHFFEYKALKAVPRESTNITLKYLGVRPNQAAFFRWARDNLCHLAVLVVPERKVYLFDPSLVLYLLNTKTQTSWEDICHRFLLFSASVDAPEELRRNYIL